MDLLEDNTQYWRENHPQHRREHRKQFVQRVQ
jgi:hypothetical protein